MNVVAYFAENGVPKTGLAPTVSIYRLAPGSGVDLVGSGSMTEKGAGFYLYDFAGYDPTKDYTFLCDGGVAQADHERYSIAATGMEGKITQVNGDLADGGRLDLIFDAIKAKTALLPADPASQAAVIAEINANETKIDGLTTLVGAIKAVTDVLPDAGALSGIVAHLVQIKGSGWTNQSLTTIQTFVTGIKSFTDGLPHDTAAALTSIGGAVAALQAELDNPDQFKANVSGLALESTSQAALEKLNNATYGLAALRELVLAIDASALQSYFDEIKGVDWTNQTLVQLSEFLRLVIDRTRNLPDDPASQSAVETAIIEAAPPDLTDEVAQLQDGIQWLKDVEGGRWQIDLPNNQMVFYKADNLTEIMRFDLLDAAGNPTVRDVFNRRRA